MDILGIGPLELIFILIIALIVLGPKDMAKAGRTIGSFLRQIVKSPTWSAVQSTSKELRNLPNKLMREAGLEEEVKEIGSIMPKTSDLFSSISVDESPKTDQQTKSEADPTDSKDNISNWITPPDKIEQPETADNKTDSDD